LAKKEVRSKKADLEFISGKIAKVVNTNLDAYCAISGTDKGEALEKAIAHYLEAQGLEPYKVPAGITYAEEDTTQQAGAAKSSR